MVSKQATSARSQIEAELLDKLDQTLVDIRRAFQLMADGQQLSDGTSRHISVATLRLLRAIVRFQEPPSVGELADSMAIDPSTASRLVDGAEKSELVERRSSGRDRRSREIRLTIAGETLLRDVSRRRRRVLSQVTKGWTSAELIQLNAMLTNLGAGLAEFERT